MLKPLRAVRRLWRLPCKLMLATMVLCLAVREWYPFSPFPMYANFGPRAWYVCVTDAADRTLPSARYLGLDATMLRRAFETRLQARAAAGIAAGPAETAAARELLEFLVREARPQPGSPPLPERIALRRTVSHLERQRVGHTHETLAVLGDE